MISKELKDIIELVGGRYIVVEDGRPKYIIMGFEEYKEAFFGKKQLQALTEEELIDRINADISLWREGQSKDEDIALDEIDDLKNIEYV
ncbi:MAG: hypothetical protein COZ28_01485 [Candidatus Moranbacteria bacterium CG_4_10_14_3_um_filter_44_15]|nr:MAG: hypothetical protein COS72_04180 [Candidatus Moranbacteria bacterium CG06_land_8_20_14_3_00_43_56]PIV84117.1 MAG: hypothetical protein COW51_01565 [Candidatus Moranbacteria bacterium CG17_big_fil_post_rev_8_21_14_2_50_44_12]PIW93426.1 MAG: hypothetical protein COZ87_01165 [Candidatus Moranbacteria bacterium CG_4_8_14_3_um_filter_43_15]PIX90796.1 MAG: hypothetical protein COZ28_01485 [Candidatus Moranbacteria bacterium CG_4_10_14_3_um_filter_44_15]PJA86231.1 MAG: hypothetical protein CO1